LGLGRVLLRSDEYKGDFRIKQAIIFSLLFVGTFFAGRTGFVGLIFGVVLYFLNIKSLLKRLFFFCKGLILLAGTVLIVFLLLPSEIKEVVVNQLLPYAFEFVYNYIDLGKTTTTSTEILSDMYF